MEERALASEVEAVVGFVAVPQAGWDPGFAVIAALFDFEHLHLFAGVDGGQELDAAIDSGDQKFRVGELRYEDAAFFEMGGVAGAGDGAGRRVVGRWVGDGDAGVVVIEFALGGAVVFDCGLDLTGEGERRQRVDARSRTARARVCLRTKNPPGKPQGDYIARRVDLGIVCLMNRSGATN